MRIVRGLIGLLGVAAGLWGASLLLPFALGPRPDAISLLEWLGGGPVLHDALIAPIVGLLGLAISRFASAAWRAPLFCGLAITGVVSLLALPSIWRTYAFAGPANVGLHDRDYGFGVLVTLAVLWLLVGATGLVRGQLARKAGPRPTG